MKQVKKILFPIDFAENYETLLPWVSTFVEKFDATLYVVFVAQDLSQLLHLLRAPRQYPEFPGRGRWPRPRSGWPPRCKEHFKNFPKLETRVLMGSPAEKILELAKKENIDLIIMGAHGRKGLERVFFGSVADKVVTGALCPVMTIHP